MHNIFWIRFAMISSQFHKAAEHPTWIKSTKFIIIYIHIWCLREDSVNDFDVAYFFFIWRFLVSNIFTYFNEIFSFVLSHKQHKLKENAKKQFKQGQKIHGYIRHKHCRMYMSAELRGVWKVEQTSFANFILSRWY